MTIAVTTEARHGIGAGAQAPAAGGTKTAAPAASLNGTGLNGTGLNGAGKPEKFLPVTRFALIDRLTKPSAWSQGRAGEARRFFRYLEYWRQQQYTAKLHLLEQTYEQFSPDSDLLITRKFTNSDSKVMQRRVIDDVRQLLEQANYTRIDPAQVEVIMTKATHYGLDLHVDMRAFEEILIYYRGQTTRTETMRRPKNFFRKEDFELPIFQRLCIVFKLKSVEQRVREIMAEQRCDRREAEKLVNKARELLPPQIKNDYIYLKLFKNIPQADLEMIFPNTRIKFRMFDKLKIGATAGGGIGAGVVGAAGKLALLTTNPIAAAGAAVGLGGVVFRQGMKVVNQKNKYMITMAQNLYFHAMADNRGVMTLLADRAAEEDVKEEILLYTVLAKERVHVDQIHDIDEAIQQFIWNEFGIRVDFDVHDALDRLIADGIVSQAPDGTLVALQPKDAGDRIDRLWDGYLDKIPDLMPNEGTELEDAEAGPA